MQCSPTHRFRPVKNALVDPLKVSQIGAPILWNVLCHRVFLVEFRAQQVTICRCFLDHDVGEHRVVLDQRIMTFAVENAKTEARGNAVIVTKAQSGTAKIDPLMSMFNTVQLMSWNPQASNSGGVVIPDDYEVC